MKDLFKKGLALRSEATKGFTLIELLIVIALIGILAVALLSAINPLEQLRKGRDSARKADSSELLNAIERFYTSYQCYPWNYTAGTGCADAGAYGPVTTPDNPDFAGGTGGADVANLITVNELKPEFQTRLETSTNVSFNRLYVIEPDGTTSFEGQVRVCFEPESATGRRGGLGQVVETASALVPGLVSECTEASYSGGQDNYADAHCYICVPQ